MILFFHSNICTREIPFGTRGVDLLIQNYCQAGDELGKDEGASAMKRRQRYD